MAVAGSVDVALDIFGGLVTDMAPADLPAGVSPDCQDVKFVPGSVQTRPGLQSMFTAIAGNPAVNYLKTYVPPTGLLRLLALDAAGSLWKESPQGALALISSAVVPASFGKSTSLFTREYLAIGDGKFGIDIPRQFDDTNFDRVSQVGPGAAPSVTDEVLSYTIATVPNTGLSSVVVNAGITNISETGNIVTVQWSAGGYLGGLHGTGVNVGDAVKIAGCAVAGYNGTWTIASVSNNFSGSDSVTFVSTVTGLGSSATGTVTLALVAIVDVGAGSMNFSVGQLINVSGATDGSYNLNYNVRLLNPVGGAIHAQPAGNAFTSGSVSGNGTVAAAGNIAAGVHKVSVIFKTRQGYLTAPAPAGSWTAAGGKRAIVANIPTGPPNVVARILLFTLTGQSFFFYTSGITDVATSNFIINDNTTTSTAVDFTDLGLSAGISADYLFKLLELGESSGVTDYGSRLFWWGERNKIGNFLNLTFDGGFTNPGSLPNFPLGWTQDAVFAPGGASALAQSQPAVWGDAYEIVGNGSTATRGLVTQTVFQDSNGVAILQPNTQYSVRARIRGNRALTQGTLHIHLFSSSASINTTGLTLTAAQTTQTYTEYIAVLGGPFTTIASDLVLRVYADGTPISNDAWLIDNIEIFPANQPFNTSIVRASKVEDPESYDGVTGFLNVSENDGFAVRSAFVIRENLYFVKEHGIYVTQDDGANEPSLWKITEVSRKVGTPSVNGVAVGQDWAVIADRTGAYFFSGGEPKKISQEIQPTWDRINWAAGQTLWVQIDLQNKRVYFGVPLDGTTAPNKILMLDYRGVDYPDEIPTSTPIHTSYSGKLLVLERSRKWSIWNIVANSGAIVERFDGTQQMFLGNGTGTGKIYQLSETTFTDDGATIAGYYTTYFHFSHDLEQAFQIGSHNKLYTYMSAFVEGSGTLVISAIPPGSTPVLPVASIPLANPASRDIEFPINVTAVRAAFKVTTANNGDWFRLARFITNAIKHPSAPVRGWN